MILNKREIKQAILDIKNLQTKYCHADTIIVYHALGMALDKLGWDFADFLVNKKDMEGK
ncbi:hypothetical protein ES707_05419 [subsurface metagenome]